MQNFSVKSLNHLNQDLFVSPFENKDTNSTRCFNIDARSEFQVSKKNSCQILSLESKQKLERSLVSLNFARKNIKKTK